MIYSIISKFSPLIKWAIKISIIISKFSPLTKWVIKISIIVILPIVYFAIAKPTNAGNHSCVLCAKEVTGNFCPDKKIGLVISSDHDPNALLRNTVEMKRRQLAKLDGFYSKEREDLLAEEKLLDMKIKKMENKINIHTLNLNPPNSQAIFGGYQDGKEVWVTHK